MVTVPSVTRHGIRIDRRPRLSPHCVQDEQSRVRMSNGSSEWLTRLFRGSKEILRRPKIKQKRGKIVNHES